MFLPSTITLKPGDSGDFVAELQRRLGKIDLYPADAISGFYDGITTNSVRQFQSMQGLNVDGVAGPETLRRLNGFLSGTSSDSKPDESSNTEEEKQQSERYVMQQTLMQQTDLGAAALEAGLQTPAQEAKLDVSKSVEGQQAQSASAQATLDQQAGERQQQELLKQTQQAPQASQLVDMLRDALSKVPQPEAGAEAKAAQAEQKMSAEMARTQQQQQPQTGEKQIELVKSNPELPKQEAAVAAEKSPRSAMVQKIIDYLESKLPTEVVRDVLNIGSNMMRAGVREAPIASGDTVRAPEAAAARAPEQVAARGG